MVNEKIASLPLIWVLGGPGSGKATVCARLEKEYNFTNVNAGGLLRAAAASGSPNGKAISDAMAAGQLVSQDIVLSVIEDYLVKHADNVKGFLVVGYPRDVPQGEAFEAKFGAVKLVLYFHCPDNVRKERLLAAHVHSDDTSATIDKRLAAYHAHSTEVVKHYGAKCTHIDANTDQGTVYAASKAAIDKLLSGA